MVELIKPRRFFGEIVQFYDEPKRVYSVNGIPEIHEELVHGETSYCYYQKMEVGEAGFGKGFTFLTRAKAENYKREQLELRGATNGQ